MKTKAIISLLSILTMIIGLAIQLYMVLMFFYTAWMPDEIYSYPPSKIVLYFMDKIEQLGLSLTFFAAANAVLFILHTTIINYILIRRQKSDT